MVVQASDGADSYQLASTVSESHAVCLVLRKPNAQVTTDNLSLSPREESLLQDPALQNRNNVVW